MSERRTSPFTEQALCQRLQAMIGQLSGIDQWSELAFLEIGRQVGAGHRRATELTALAEKAFRPGGHESAELTVARLQSLTERGAHWLGEARDRSKMICGILHALERDVAALSRPLSDLGKVVKTLQALRVATRIEAARSHGQGALVLGQELHQLGRQMQEKLELIAQRCEVLDTLRQRAVTIEERAQEGALSKADVEIRRTRALLEEAASQCTRSADQTSRLRQHSSLLADKFGEMVAALQFQDITRQRLQHVCAALASLSASVLAGSDRGQTGGSVCQLQYEQLAWAVGEFSAAIDRLDRNLRGMSEGARELAADARSALMGGTSEQCSRISPSLQAVAECLENVGTTHLAAGQAVFAVCQAVGDIAALSAGIEQVGEEMQLLAQNAAVSAAHGSVRAAGLTVIAGNIQTLAEDAGRYAAIMADGCQKITARVGDLDCLDQQSSEQETDLARLLEEVRTLVGRLGQVNQEFDGLITALGRQTAELGEGITETLAEFDVEGRFLLEVNPVLDELQALAREYGASEQEGEGENLIAGLRSRYTMMSEREVHHRFLRRNLTHSDADDKSLPSPSGAGLGSNVELF